MEDVETVIIGAGQAGLATAQRLRKRGRDCVVLDHNQRIGDNWRQQWDSLRLYSPARFDGLPGMRFPADPWSFPTKDDVAAYLEAYAGRWDLPVRLGVRVERPHPGRGRRLRRHHGCRDDPLRQRGGRDRHLRADARRSPTSPPTWIRRSCSCTPASTADPGNSGTGPSSWSAPRTPARTSPTSWPPRGRPPSSAGTAVRSRSAWSRALIPVVFPILMFAWRHVRDPSHADGPQGDGGDPLPRRADAAGQARRPRRARSGPARGAGRGRPRRAPALGRRHHR